MSGGEIITGYDDSFAPVANLTLPAMRDYADRHGFAFSVAHFEAGERAPVWLKIPAIQAALARGADPVIWIDADALIVRPHFDIRSALAADRDLFVVRESKAPIPHANFGLVVVRNTSWSTQFLDRLWRSPLSPEHAWQEQAAFLHLIGERAILGRGEADCPDREILSHIGWLDERWNYTMVGRPVRLPFIRHYAGMPSKARIALIRFDKYGGKDLTPLVCRASRWIALHRIRLRDKVHRTAGLRGAIYRLRYRMALAVQAVLPKMI